MRIKQLSCVPISKDENAGQRAETFKKERGAKLCAAQSCQIVAVNDLNFSHLYIANGVFSTSMDTTNITTHFVLHLIKMPALLGLFIHFRCLNSV